MIRQHELRRPVWIFDPEDRYARDRAVRGRHPRPLGHLAFRLLEKVDEALDFDPPLELVTGENPSGYHVFFGQVHNTNGPPRLSLAEGTYAVRVESELYQLAERHDLEFPAAAGPVHFDLDPSYLYPFPRTSTLGAGRGPTLLRGGVYHQDGGGVEDVRVQSDDAAYTYRTDASGQWLLVFPDFLFADPRSPRQVRVNFSRPSGETTTVDGVVLVPGRENSLSQTALRGWVTGENSGRVRSRSTIVDPAFRFINR